MERRTISFVLLATGLAAGLGLTTVPQAVSEQAHPVATVRLLQPLTSAQEILFLDEMKAHHEQAVTISALVLERTANVGLRAVTRAIVLVETRELETIDTWLADSALDVHFDTSPNGLATPSQLAKLHDAHGEDFDRFAVELLLSNQMASLEIARLSARAVSPQVASLAAGIAERQSTVVSVLKDWTAVNRG